MLELHPARTPENTYQKILIKTTGWARLIQSLQLARFSFKLSENLIYLIQSIEGTLNEDSLSFNTSN